MSAAALDADVFVEMVMGPLWQAWRPSHWQTGVLLAAATIDRLTERDIDLVVLAGPFFKAPDRTLLLSALHSSPTIHFLTLRTTLEETLRRCEADNTRVVTKDRSFVERIYAETEWGAAPESDIVLDSETLHLDEVVAEAVSRLGIRNA